MSSPVHPALDPSPAEPATPRLRIVRVPTPQPPLADEPVRLVHRGVAVPRPPHRPGPRPRLDHHRPFGEFGPSWSSRSDLPSPAVAGRQLLLLVLEVFAGRRPLGQLRPMTTPRLFEAVAGGRRPPWCSGGTAPLLLGPVHVCEPVDGVAEISAVARRSGRAHAVAARLEGLDGRWRCTALRIG
jgi:Family of unknown function (DUF6459)